jgi:hypothetical protein
MMFDLAPHYDGKFQKRDDHRGGPVKSAEIERLVRIGSLELPECGVLPARLFGRRFCG